MESVEMRWWQGAEVFQEGYVVEGRLYLDDTFFFLVFLGEEISKPKVTKEGKKYTASSVFFGFFWGVDMQDHPACSLIHAWLIYRVSLSACLE